MEKLVTHQKRILLKGRSELEASVLGVRRRYLSKMLNLLELAA